MEGRRRTSGVGTHRPLSLRVLCRPQQLHRRNQVPQVQGRLRRLRQHTVLLLPHPRTRGGRDGHPQGPRQIRLPPLPLLPARLRHQGHHARCRLQRQLHDERLQVHHRLQQASRTPRLQPERRRQTGRNLHEVHHHPAAHDRRERRGGALCRRRRLHLQHRHPRALPPRREAGGPRQRLQAQFLQPLQRLLPRARYLQRVHRLAPGSERPPLLQPRLRRRHQHHQLRIQQLLHL